jgi:hypothetical protein
MDDLIVYSSPRAQAWLRWVNAYRWMGFPMGEAVVLATRLMEEVG